MLGIGALLGGVGVLGGVAAIPYVGPVIAFFTTPLGRLVGVVLVVLTAYGYGWFKGDAHGDAQCAASAKRVEIARKKVEISLAKAQARADKTTIEELDKQKRAAEENLRALQAKIKNNANDVYDSECRVPAPGGVRDNPRSGS